MFQFSDVTARV